MSKVWRRTPHPSIPDKGATGKPLLHKLPRIWSFGLLHQMPQVPYAKKGHAPYRSTTFESNVRREGVSFANIVNGITHPSTPTPIHKLTEKTNENSNNKVSHGIQAIENENSDLAQVIELVGMISNIIKRSPEILQLLPKLKNSEDDKAKALLLFEAMLDNF
ncbi:hypothetical protein TNCV_3132441 [Trichonephila clavipes]|nr:hypothetical protein TNCV_3132441 [Trichonephila clavipes]